MTSITSTTSAAAQTGGTIAGAKLTADFNMFLKMLTTQLQYQDPLDPMDTSEYTQQLVSYSQVEQAIQQTSKLDAILGRLSAQDLASATGYIGKAVDVYQPTASLGADGARWFYELDANASATGLGIYDSRGVRVALLDGETTKGRHAITWQGDGRTLGNYELRVEAMTAGGEKVSTRVGTHGRVDSVEATGTDIVLNLGGTRVRTADIAAISAH